MVGSAPHDQQPEPKTIESPPRKRSTRLPSLGQMAVDQALGYCLVMRQFRLQAPPDRCGLTQLFLCARGLSCLLISRLAERF